MVQWDPTRKVCRTIQLIKGKWVTWVTKQQWNDEQVCDVLIVMILQPFLFSANSVLINSVITVYHRVIDVDTMKKPTVHMVATVTSQLV